jgi:hypothetical protein
MSNKFQIVTDHALASCRCGKNNLRGRAIDLGYGKEGRGRYAQYCECGEMTRYDLKCPGVRALTAHEKNLLSRHHTDIELPNDPEQSEEAINRFARNPVADRRTKRT